MALPKYIQIADELKQRIQQGEFTNKMLPKEIDMQQQYSVSRVTIRKAIQILVDDELIKRVKGTGTFVNEKAIAYNAFSLKSFTEEVTLAGKQPSYILVSFNKSDIDAYPDVKLKLNLESCTDIYVIERVLNIDNEPEIYEISYLPCDILPSLKFEQLVNSKYALIESHLGKKITKNNKKMSATHPSSHIAKELNITRQTPIIREEAIGYFSDDEAFEMTVSYYRGFNYEFSFDAFR
jgi:GntR family glv operon transcriptional regulator/GntR family mannosyl-D-glycerate transport/metabolism transcriptional repressor